MFDDRCPKFFRLLRQSFQVLLAMNPNYTGKIVVTIHVENGVAKMVGVDPVERARKWEEVSD